MKGEKTVPKRPEPPKNAVVIVLGAQVFNTLQNRVQAAAEYLLENPKACCITTGGQGWNEPRTEGEAARQALIELGIAPERVFAEVQSTTTWENLCFAKEILEREKLGTDVVLATQSFHQWRAGKMAERLGLMPYTLVAADRPGTKLRHTAREGLAILKFLLFNNKQ